jgi:hypothetical protein
VFTVLIPLAQVVAPIIGKRTGEAQVRHAV